MTPSDAIVESGTSVTLTCVTASTGADVTYHYIRDGTTFDTNDKGSHVINDVTTSETGSYTCTVTINSMTSEPSDGHMLTVFGECNKVKVKSSRDSRFNESFKAFNPTLIIGI